MKCIIGTVPPQALIKNQLASAFLSVIQIVNTDNAATVREKKMTDLKISLSS
jgi:hypothetical protein